MLARIFSRTRREIAGWALLACCLVAMPSCATKETALISDPNAAHETSLPWNEQQKWEREGQAAALNQNRR